MKVLLVTNPAADGAFRSTAQRLLGQNGHAPETLQSHLREEYPRASVVRGIQDKGAERWYAYREGVWVDSARR
jgi:hypothetical protein